MKRAALMNRGIPWMAGLMMVGGMIPSSHAWEEPAQEAKGPRTREVSTLVVYETEEGTIGRCEPVQITVLPQSDPNTFRVGIYETEVGGTGGMWRSAAWMSTAAASLATGFSPETRHVTFDVVGRIDGPSAGAIMTIGILAAVRGDTLNPSAAMTGMINPDFSIGPVGGIPHKIRGAAAAGKNLVLIPAGSRFDFDKNLKREVDLVQLGRSLGVTVEPVADLFTAYQMLTGESFPRWADADAEPRYPADLEQKSIVRVKDYLVRYQQMYNQYSNCPDDAKSEATIADGDNSRRLSEQAQGLLRENDLVGAMRLAFEASFTAAGCYQCARLSDIYQKRGLEAAINDVKTTLVPWPRIDLAIESIKEVHPTTMREVSGVLDAYSCLIEAINLTIEGDQLMAREGANDDEKLENVVDAAVKYQYALIDLDGMKETLEDWRGGAGQLAPDPERVALAAQLFRRVTEANLSMFETLFIEPQAKAAGTTVEAVRSDLMSKEFAYSQMQLSMRVLRVLAKQLGPGPELDYATLTAMRDSYVNSAQLIAKHYSLQVTESDEEGLRVGKERTLRGMLDFADDQARRGIAHLERIGVDTAGPMSPYLVGRMKRERELYDKIAALNYLWVSNLSARILAMLSAAEEPSF